MRVPSFPPRLFVPQFLVPPLLVPLLAVLVFGSIVPSARAQVSRNITLLSNLNLYPPEYSACWSYVHADGREYAVILTSKGASFVRLTDPTHPVEVGFITATNKPWVEAKQYRDHVYLTTEAVKNFETDPNDAGLAIIDMRNPDQPHKVASLRSPITAAHTLAIDQDRGLLYMNGVITCPSPDFTNCEYSMKIFSLANPEDPVLLATFPHYVHDIHVRGTLGFASLIFEDFLPGATDGIIAVLDLSDPANPREITRIFTPRFVQHSTWTSEDGRYLYAANEVPRDGLTVWDISNLSSPRLVFTFEDLPRHVVHQPHVVGNTLSLSYYTAGVRLMDIRNPAWPVEFGFYDTYPSTADEGFYSGAWECAPFYPSGIFVVSDIQTGLWVFRANPVNYGIVRGTVRDGSTGPTIAGATVTVQPAGFTVKSGLDGRYAFAVPAGGAATVTVSTYAFEVTSKTVNVALNSDQTLNIPLKRLPAGTLRGTVRAASNAAVLGGAEVEILGTPLRAVANAQGVYTFPSVPVGSYSVRAARGGHAARTGTASVSKGTTTLNVSLGNVLFFDDAETDRGWTLGGPGDLNCCGIGNWERTAPVGKILCDTGEQLQPGEDHSLNPGTNCFVTDNRQLECVSFVGAVVGTMTLTSPVLHLGGVADPRIGYWRWLEYTTPRVPSVAALIVLLSNDGGANWVTVETFRTGKPAWEFAEIRVGDFFSNPGDVLVRFVADNSAFDFFRPEVAIDDFAFYSGSVGGSSSLAAAMPIEAPAFAVGALRPSPTRSAAEVELSLPRNVHVRVAVYDLQGRLVRSVLEADVPAGRSTIRWDGRTRDGEPAASGVYWMTIQAGEEKRKSKLVVVR